MIILKWIAAVMLIALAMYVSAITVAAVLDAVERRRRKNEQRKAGR